MGDGHRKRKGTLASEDFVMNVREECMNRRTHFIIITAYYMYIWRNRAQVLIRLAIAYVAGTENLLDLARDEELLELEGEVVYAMRDMQISNDKDEDHESVSKAASATAALSCSHQPWLRVSHPTAPLLSSSTTPASTPGSKAISNLP